MTYEEAIALARAGEERGFGYLYQNTYKSKYYLALQYMKNEEAAQDVLQDSYFKAFSRLDTLNNPEAFSGWLGQIVANTAKNMLQKKNPLLFSDIAVDEDEESFEYEIEDDRIENQPEMAYTRQETQHLVHEMIDSLSEEQRLCILMFHIEGQSISEIAAAMNCSENTVKSRLNYGRKNLKVKAEELQKKGYKLYSTAPILLLLYLLKVDAGYMEADGVFSLAGRKMAQEIMKPFASVDGTSKEYAPGNVDRGDTGKENAHGATGRDSANGIGASGKAVRTGFVHSTLGKVILAAVCVGILGGIALCVVSQLRANAQEAEMATAQEAADRQAEETVAATPDVTETPRSTETPQVTEIPDTPKALTDQDYPNLIEGNLTKEEMAFVLAYGPETMTEASLADSEYPVILNAMCQASAFSGGYIADYGYNENSTWNHSYSLNDVNRLFSSFTAYQYTEGNGDPYNVHVEGDSVMFSPATLSYQVTATIQSAQQTEEKITIYYTYAYKHSIDNTQYTKYKKAILRPQVDGLYRIVSITEVTLEEITEAQTAMQTTESSQSTSQSAAAGSSTAEGRQTMKDIYAGVLQSVANQEEGYGFPSLNGGITGYDYFVYDMNGDGIQELIVGAEFAEDAMVATDCRVYSCTKASSGYSLQMISGEAMAVGVFLAADGNGFFKTEFVRTTGTTSVYRITLQGDTLVVSDTSEYNFTMGDAAQQQFISDNPTPVWLDITDLSGLDNLTS